MILSYQIPSNWYHEKPLNAEPTHAQVRRTCFLTSLYVHAAYCWYGCRFNKIRECMHYFQKHSLVANYDWMCTSSYISKSQLVRVLRFKDYVQLNTSSCFPELQRHARTHTRTSYPLISTSECVCVRKSAYTSRMIWLAVSVCHSCESIP